MSLTSIISSASAALTKTQVAIAVSNTNVANAGDASNSRKTWSASANTSVLALSEGQIARTTNAYLSRTAIAKAAESGYAGVVDQHLQSYDAALGSADGGDDVASLLDAFDAALASLAASPTSSAEKASVVAALDDLVSGIGELSDEIQALRTEANRSIADTVDAINAALSTVADLNDQIAQGAATGGDVSGLEDQRDAALGELSGLMGVSYYTTADNRVVVYAPSGDLLVGSTAASLSYAASSTLDAASAYPADISGVYLNGKDMTTSLSGGELGGLIALRDEILPAEQASLDALAADLIDQVNTIANQGTAWPAPNVLTSTTAVSAGDAFSASGSVRVAVLSADGTVVSTQDLDLSAYATMADLVAALDGVDGLSAAISADGELVLSADDPSAGVALGALDGAVGADGEGFSAFFGFNDLLTGSSAADIAVSGALGSDASRLPVGALSDETALAAGDIGLASGDLATLTALTAALQGDSLSGAATRFVSGAATLVSSAAADAESAQSAYDYALSRLQNETAVNLDEELALLAQYQTQYEANAQMISMARELFDALVSMVS
ncbi:MAG: flagellar hook-associated protein FlgK [Phenylobacterium sp.]|uniref:flagellar hook-associated protein FlgK n=1 Tax=Phenylobacterium sp. TaxID=1871053 RepID=UPI0039195DF4